MTWKTCWVRRSKAKVAGPLRTVMFHSSQLNQPRRSDHSQKVSHEETGLGPARPPFDSGNPVPGNVGIHVSVKGEQRTDRAHAQAGVSLGASDRFCRTRCQKRSDGFLLVAEVA